MKVFKDFKNRVTQTVSLKLNTKKSSEKKNRREEEEEIVKLLKNFRTSIEEFVNKSMVSTSDKEREFNQVMVSLDTLLKIKDDYWMKTFDKAIEKETHYRDLTFNGKQIFIPKSDADMVETFAHVYIQSKLEKDFANHFIKWIKDVDRPVGDYITKMLKKPNLEYLDYVLMTFLTQHFNELETSNNLMIKINEIIMGEFIDNDFQEDFQKLSKIIDIQLRSLKGDDKKIIVGPNFGSAKAGISAEGDYIIGETYVEVYCSQTNKLERPMIQKLLAYAILNQMLPTPLEFKRFAIWNPYFACYEEIRIRPDLNLADLFHNLRTTFCNNYKGKLIRMHQIYQNYFFTEIDKTIAALDKGTITMETAMEHFNSLRNEEWILTNEIGM